MADRVFICPEMTADFIHQGIALPPQMIKDMLGISQIPLEEIDAIATAVEAEVGFLGRKKLFGLVSGIVDKSSASSVVNALQNLLPQRLEQIVEAIGEWRQANGQNTGKFPDQAFADLEVKLPRLIRDYPSLSRSRKAQRLRSILGNAVQGVEIICDARPVYNAERTSIEGLIPLTTMKIEYEGQDEETREVEVMLTREDVNEFAEKVKKAQQKLDVLDRSIEQWIPVGLADFE